MKKDYDIYVAIKNNSGFGWDNLQSVPTAPEGVWAAYIKAHPEAEKFRKRSLLHYDILHELCANISATGEFALTSTLFTQSETQSQTFEPVQNRTSKSPTRRLAMNEDLINERWGGSQVSQVNGEMENGFTGGSDEGARRAVVIATGEHEGKGISAVWSGVGVPGRGATSSGERKRGKRSALEAISGDEAEEGEGYLPVEKRKRAERKTSGRAIAQALDRLGATAQTIQRTKVELAIERLQQDYTSVFTIDELVKGFEVMENEVKASIFIALQSGEARDKWLREAIERL